MLILGVRPKMRISRLDGSVLKDASEAKIKKKGDDAETLRCRVTR